MFVIFVAVEGHVSVGTFARPSGVRKPLGLPFFEHWVQWSPVVDYLSGSFLNFVRFCVELLRINLPDFCNVCRRYNMHLTVTSVPSWSLATLCWPFSVQIQFGTLHFLDVLPLFSAAALTSVQRFADGPKVWWRLASSSRTDSLWTFDMSIPLQLHFLHMLCNSLHSKFVPICKEKLVFGELQPVLVQLAELIV